MTKAKKKRFEVEDGETIDACLERIKREGYTPVKRIEKPIFEEQIIEGISQYEPVKRQIIFETKIME